MWPSDVECSSASPEHRDGTVIIVSPKAQVRRGDRVVVKTRNGELMAKELVRKTAKTIELKSLNPDHGERIVPKEAKIIPFRAA